MNSNENQNESDVAIYRQHYLAAYDFSTVNQHL